VRVVQLRPGHAFDVVEPDEVLLPVPVRRVEVRPHTTGNSTPLTPGGHMIGTGACHAITSSPNSERDAWLILPLGRRIGLAPETDRRRPRQFPVGLRTEVQVVQVDGTQPDFELPLAEERRRIEVRGTRPIESAHDSLMIRRSAVGVAPGSVYHLIGGRAWIMISRGQGNLLLGAGGRLRPIELESADGLTMPPVVECNFEWRR
jgi:hypothetical protein